MPQIRCRYVDCFFLESGYCTAEVVKIDPDEGCMTYTRIGDVSLEDVEDWDDEELDDMDELWVDEEEDDEEEGEWIDDEIF
jgi:hypothetical protein